MFEELKLTAQVFTMDVKHVFMLRWLNQQGYPPILADGRVLRRLYIPSMHLYPDLRA